MKDEIKEILDIERYRNKDGYVENINLLPDEIHKLLDYITNLQTIEQQYSAILSENAELENKITNLQKENEKIRKMNMHKHKYGSDMEGKYIIEKAKNKKAIEKLESIRVFGLISGKTLFSTLINEAIDTLNGGDE